MGNIIMFLFFFLSGFGATPVTVNEGINGDEVFSILTQSRCCKIDDSVNLDWNTSN